MNASDRLLDLVDEAIVAGLKPLRLNQAVTPFTLTLTIEGVVMRRFPAETITASIEQARAALAAAGDTISAYVLVYDATVEIGGNAYDALMLESGERGDDQGWRFVQRYQPRTATEALYPIGKMAYLGMAPLYFGA